MIPVIGQDNLGLGAAGIGLLASMDGVGAFCGAALIALFAKPPVFARLYIGGVFAYLSLLPVFAVASHPHDPLTAWFVPAISDEVRVPVDGRMVVTRTRDGGESFVPVSGNLPPIHSVRFAR